VGPDRQKRGGDHAFFGVGVCGRDPALNWGIFASAAIRRFAAPGRTFARFHSSINLVMQEREMDHWVLATLFANGSEPRDVYINLSFVTKMERVDDHTEIEFSSGTLVSVAELPHKLIGHKPDRPSRT
jgi:hypothetical protein